MNDSDTESTSSSMVQTENVEDILVRITPQHKLGILNADLLRLDTSDKTSFAFRTK